jgi:hypothetical protein
VCQVKPPSKFGFMQSLSQNRASAKEQASQSKSANSHDDDDDDDMFTNDEQVESCRCVSCASVVWSGSGRVHVKRSEKKRERRQVVP